MNLRHNWFVQVNALSCHPSDAAAVRGIREETGFARTVRRAIGEPATQLVVCRLVWMVRNPRNAQSIGVKVLATYIG